MLKKQGLYDPAFEHDACGVGFVANINGLRSHEIVQNGVSILKNLEHRGAVGGDSKTGDGAGILIQIPHTFLARECTLLGFNLPAEGQYGAGFLFLPADAKVRAAAIKRTNDTLAAEGATVLGWRDVPTDPDCLGEMARDVMPFMAQVFVTVKGFSGDALERKIFVLRKCCENAAYASGLLLTDYYFPSFSSRTMVYKGMFVALQVECFFPDLNDPDFISAIALVHQRYSTNTFPSWALAQPFRFLAHNGEINTLRGNINKMHARQKTLSSKLYGDDMKKLFPIVNEGLSDSGMLDNAFELVFMGGRSLEHTMAMMVPEAWGVKYHMSQDKRSFYEFHSAIMEPWDGPAALAFTDGIRIGATLDRNGLRPSRFVISKSGKIVCASEVGVIDIAPEDVVRKGRLAPGKMLLVDTTKGRVMYDHEIKSIISRSQPYRRWVEKNRIELKGLFEAPGQVPIDEKKLPVLQKAFGYTLEELNMIVTPMAETGQEPVGSMGNDMALAVLSERPQLLYSYFKQLFAQVTNPPIDPYRENLVMSLMSFVGCEGNLLEEKAEDCRQLKLPHPVLTNEDMVTLRTAENEFVKVATVDMLFGATDEHGPTLAQALSDLCSGVEKKIDEGYTLVVISDKEINETLVPIPALLAISTVHNYLIKIGKRTSAGLIVETGEARDVMHFATLSGYGANAYNPYLAFESISALKLTGRIKADLKIEAAMENYITAIKKGLLKVMSKMGVSTIRSYRGAQIFEAIGLNSDVIQSYFPGTASRIEGIGLDVIAREVRERHAHAFAKRPDVLTALESGGNIHFRRFSEKHLLTPDAITLVQKSIRTGDYEIFKQYTTAIGNAEKNLCTLRGLFSFKNAKAISIDEVEPVESIVKRFVSSAMSFGSISKEAHETMAIAMNRLGAMSNSGEGGEDEARYIPLPNGDSAKSSVKQVASGRFGVTINYLVNSNELQIKMAQGAKPGEGGQLPGEKVDKVIAKVRHSTPGVMLISPPPHHDIYSIEDLAQLIFDLKNANTTARVSVKLVSEVGVGTVAAGVAKGKADMVLISGGDGGTGASPISSIKYAGAPWEIGVAETQQTLVMNKLRDRIRIQADGQMRTGRDVVIAALLGAEEYGFGTISLVSLGCIMMRKCHLNTCPVGIATQDTRLRERFAGKPEYLINFMTFIAQEAREIMASLGFRTIDEMIGRVDVLDVNTAVSHYKTQGLDFSKILTPIAPPAGAAVRCMRRQEHDFSLSLDPELIKNARAAIDEKKPVKLFASIKNCNRTVGTTLSSEIARKWGQAGLPNGTIHVKFNGSAGQTFGGFLSNGVTFELEGDANDYFGKGLSGGQLIVYPPKNSTFRPQNNSIVGNVVLFGATSGEIYINGMAGERFAVRNSGATAVVEGVGDHGCEYMTGGVVVVLGRTGVNFAAGMSGGIAFVLDDNQLFDTRCNLEMVDIEPVMNSDDQELLYSLIQKHVQYTGSEYAAQILRDWTEMLPMFVKVMPMDYRKALERLRSEEAKESESVAMTEEVFR